jgi:endonuclease III
MKITEFVRKYGQPYSETLGINLKSGSVEEITKWFLASILYSKPIRENSATKTYKCFERHNVHSVESILKAGWEKLVSILDEGGYTRYDFSTADKLLEVFRNLKRLYGGDLTRLYEDSKDSKDLEEKIKSLGKGIGDTTVSIFLRDMRMVWRKADPKPTPLVEKALKALNIGNLKAYADEKGLDIVWLETALLRYAKDFLKKGKTLTLER